ncbi:efflux RND transporter periplasmic adaptor subunit [Schaalia sp. ZJ405]|uniref:efflux RND transporter periplasmic adaptor subunit n=1 Tax=unclassified Schaalia TaxID=2691889 RepID=UPI0013ED1181|nr:MULTISPECIES: efflux RND transporter periplasmic adaptor subunit [unclassified Schaalia]QPK81809.1 efflux RND transporter periplasmic adaptor subunit [Schaalia sp. ZJ405]
MKVNDSVKAGQVLGWNNGAEIHAPVDAVVRRVAEASDDVPAHYSVLELEYQGFAVTVDAAALLAVAPIESLTGRFQIAGGLGPTDIYAIVTSPGDQEPASEDQTPATTHNAVFQGVNAVVPVNSSNAGAPDEAEESVAPSPEQPAESEPKIGPRPRVASQTLLCLIGKDQPVRPGQVATVVLAGQAQADVLAVPVSAVAGRVGKGTVTLVHGETTSLVEVGLGISDGAYIEITSGLSEGDVISAVAPYLDPRKK